MYVFAMEHLGWALNQILCSFDTSCSASVNQKQFVPIQISQILETCVLCSQRIPNFRKCNLMQSANRKAATAIGMGMGRGRGWERQNTKEKCEETFGMPHADG